MAARRTRASTSPDAEAATAPPTPARRILGLDDILGQGHAVDVLLAAARAGRIHHAWIFHGPPGVGKFTTALAFAALLLDPTTAPDLSGRLAPDPESETRRLLRAGAHPDLHIVNKELAAVSSDGDTRTGKQRVIPVEVVREFLIGPAERTRSVVAKSLAGKVFIVDEAELLGRSGQNAMLKTLEEPAPGSVIILVTSSEDRLLPTIRSRCQRVAFSTLDDATLREWYERAGMPSEPPEHREWLLRYAGGSPGWIASAVEHGLFAWGQTLEPMLSQIDAGRPAPALGSAMHALVEEKAAAWVKANPEASKEAANFAWSRRMFGFLAERYRLAYREALMRGGASASGDRFVRALDAISTAEEHAAANVNLQFVFENLAAQLMTRLARPAQRAVR